MTKPYFIIAEPTDYISFPGGGQIQQAKNLMESYGNNIALVGYTSDNSCKTGCWTKRLINNIEYDYFSVKKIRKNHTKTIIPQRLIALASFWYYRKKITKHSTKNLFLQAPEVVFALKNQKWKSICYRFPGTTNPLDSPRYTYGKYLKFIFEKPLFNSISKADCILASADDYQINVLAKRSEGILNKEKIIKYPTRFDDQIYKPLNMNKCRKDLGLNISDKIFIQIGRLSKNKGCSFILEGFKEYVKTTTNAKLLFLGDGEERKNLENYVSEQNLSNKVIFFGHKSKQELPKYISCANAIVFGSLCKRWKESWDEGWSVAMVESLACGKPIISTPVSGSFDMIKEPQNGYILKNRDPNELAVLFEKVTKLENPNNTSIKISEPWKMSLLKNDFENGWKTIRNFNKIE